MVNTTHLIELRRVSQGHKPVCPFIRSESIGPGIERGTIIEKITIDFSKN
jgi:hypothetical protein